MSALLRICLSLTFFSTFIVGCSRRVETEVDSNSSAVEGLSVVDLSKYLLDRSKFKNCKRSDLEPVESVWNLTEAQRKIADEITGGLSADELALAAVEFAQNLDIEIPARSRESVIMYLFKTAAEKENPIALAEIGASLLFCYNHVKQDVSQARLYLERASAAGDSYAMRSLASMHLSGLTDDQDAKALGRELLEKCRNLGNPQC